MKIYNKLVRDKIPDIILNNGCNAITRSLSNEEYWICLKQKLCEEVNEFISDNTVEELADIYEVLLAILKHLGISYDSFIKVVEKKASERGAFNDKVFLEYVIKL